MRSRTLCLIVLLAVCGFISASVWHSHEHGTNDKCAACQLLHVSATEPPDGLEVDPQMVVSRTEPGIPCDPEINHTTDSNTSRAPPSGSFL